MNLPAIHRQPAELSMREPSNFASLVQRSRFTRELVRCVVDRMWWFTDGGVSLGARALRVRGGSPDQLLNFSTLPTERVVLDLLDFLG